MSHRCLPSSEVGHVGHPLSPGLPFIRSTRGGLHRHGHKASHTSIHPSTHGHTLHHGHAWPQEHACSLRPYTYTESDARGTDPRYSFRSTLYCPMYTSDIYILRHAGVGVLSLRRAPNLGKLARATCIPAPGPISVSLALKLSHPVASVILHPPPRENTSTGGVRWAVGLCRRHWAEKREEKCRPAIVSG